MADVPKKRSPEMADLFTDDGKPLVENVDTTNEFALGLGHNLPNHSMSMIGRSAYIAPTVRDVPLFRTRQSAYRYAAWLMTMAETLPHEDSNEHSWEQILHAIRNS